MTRIFVYLALLSVTFSCGRSDPGADDYRSGNFNESWSAYEDMGSLEGVGEERRLKNIAHAALGAGRLEEAEIALEKLGVRGGEAGEEFRDFFEGNLAFASCLRAEILAERVEAGPIAFDAAILYADHAIEAWRKSLLAEAWSAKARRNLERALLAKKRIQIKRKTAAAIKNKKAKLPKPPRPSAKNKPKPEFEDRKIEAQLKELSEDELANLMGRLQRKQAEKIRARRQAKSQQASGSGGG